LVFSSSVVVGSNKSIGLDAISLRLPSYPVTSIVAV